MSNGPLQFPTVNRKDKRDLLISRAREPMPPLPPALTIKPMPEAEVDAPLKQDKVEGRFDPYAEYEFGAIPDEPLPASAPAQPAAAAPAKSDAAPPKESARLFFGANPLAAGEQQIKPWAAGEAPVVSSDPDLKMAALTPQEQADDGKGGESIANKGVVTGEDQRPKSPAERLALTGAVIRQSRAMSRRGRLLRVARRAGARADRRRASHHEPRVLAVLSERRLRRRAPEQQLAAVSLATTATAFPTW